MGMGPTKQPAELRVSTLTKARTTAKKIIEAYFQKPLDYLFYGMLALTIVGLFFDKKLSIEYYSILVALAGIKIYQYFYGAKPGAKNA